MIYRRFFHHDSLWKNAFRASERHMIDMGVALVTLATKAK